MKTHTTSKKLLIIFFSLIMALILLPTTAFADGETMWDISTGDLTIGTSDGDYIITGSSTAYTVMVTGGTHNITLRDVTIDADSSALMLNAFDICPGATVNLNLEGTNTLKGGNDSHLLATPDCVYRMEPL